MEDLRRRNVVEQLREIGGMIDRDLVLCGGGSGGVDYGDTTGTDSELLKF